MANVSQDTCDERTTAMHEKLDRIIANQNDHRVELEGRLTALESKMTTAGGLAGWLGSFVLAVVSGAAAWIWARMTA